MRTQRNTGEVVDVGVDMVVWHWQAVKGVVIVVVMRVPVTAGVNIVLIFCM